MTVETLLRWAAGALAYLTLAILLLGIWRGARRQAGRTSGRAAWLRSPIFNLAASSLFFGLCYLGWIPLALSVPPPARAAMLALGALLYFTGIAFVLWGRHALGEYYFVSTVLGAQLFAGQKLITTGPFAIVRHPMYLGLVLAAWGSLLIYLTWTTLFFAIFAPAILLRGRQEERALKAEFGEQWVEYCNRVPAYFPRLRT